MKKNKALIVPIPSACWAVLLKFLWLALCFLDIISQESSGLGYLHLFQFSISS